MKPDIWHDPLFLADLKGGGQGGSASGPIVTFQGDGSPLRSLRIGIDPVQEGAGDPSPDNVRPISGWDEANLWRTGKNLLDIDRTLGAPVPTDISNTTSPRVFDVTKYYKGTRSDNYYYANYVDVSIASNAVTVTVLGGNTAYGAGFPVSVNGGRSYAFRANSENGIVSFGFYDAWWHWLSGTDPVVLANSGGTATVVAPENAAYMLIVLRSTTLNLATTFTDIQLELSSTPTAYTPYSGNQFTIQLGQTVYGGTLDVLSGVLRVTHGLYTVPSGLSWRREGSETKYYTFEYVFSVGNLGLFSAKVPVDNGRAVPIQTSIGSFDIPYNSLQQYTQAVNIARDSRLTCTKDLIDTMAIEGVQICYELATPITIPLTPQEISTLAGQNVLWADCGDVAVEWAGGKGFGKEAMLAWVMNR